MKVLTRCFITAAVLLGICVTFVYAEQEKIETSKKVFKWKAQTYAQPGTIVFKASEDALKSLKVATGGRLDIKLYGSGTLVGAFKVLDAMGKGLFQCSMNPTVFFTGKDPAFAPLFSLVGLWPDTNEARVWLYHFDGIQLAEELYGRYNVKYIGPIMMGVEPIFSKRPIKTLDDLKGMKIRTTPGMGSMLFSKLGASPVNLPGGEIYTALDTGVIDAAEWVNLTEDYQNGLHEVCKYFLWPSFHCAGISCDWSANMDAWNSLPSDLKAAMKMMVYEMDNRMDYYLKAGDVKTLGVLKGKGLVHTQLSEADMKKARTYSREVCMEWRDKSEMSKRMIDSALNYMKLRGLID